MNVSVPSFTYCFFNNGDIRVFNPNFPIFFDCEFHRVSHASPQIAEILSRLLFVSVGGMMEQCDPQGSVGTAITSHNLKRLSVYITSVFVLMGSVGILVWLLNVLLQDS
jgi:hypothetical protein